jgi:hypothetical protein
VRHAAGEDALRRVALGEVDAREQVRGEVRERLALRLQVDVVAVGDVAVRLVGVLRDEDDALGVRIRQGAEHDAADDAEDGRRRADA